MPRYYTPWFEINGYNKKKMKSREEWEEKLRFAKCMQTRVWIKELSNLMILKNINGMDVDKEIASSKPLDCLSSPWSSPKWLQMSHTTFISLREVITSLTSHKGLPQLYCPPICLWCHYLVIPNPMSSINQLKMKSWGSLTFEDFKVDF